MMKSEGGPKRNFAIFQNPLNKAEETIGHSPGLEPQRKNGKNRTFVPQAFAHPGENVYSKG
jgi:hypothetical protein